ncbi:cilia- and flagella-associated protein 251-like [Eriocheir sinensis]|uniref:cilia- and flagella-associated protein 251-like n=1 Tax=Eriocheir sinensis TaxID=95602 RepID=UPI0021C87884|nr:cilia- and flagella-associated protein 251-like [Eriocheir sinensis]
MLQQLQLAVQTFCDTDSRAATTTVALTYTDVAARAKEEQGEKSKVEEGREEEEGEQKESGGCVEVEEVLAETDTERREEGGEEKKEEEADVQLTGTEREPPYPLGWEEPVARLRCAEHLVYFSNCEECLSGMTAQERQRRLQERRDRISERRVERRERLQQLNGDGKTKKRKGRRARRLQAKAEEELSRRPRKIRFNLKDVPKPVKDREFLYRLYQSRKGGMVQQWRNRLAALNNSEAAWRQELEALAAKRGWRAEGLEYTERSVQEEEWGAEAKDEHGEKGGRECLEGKGEEGVEERKEEEQGEEGRVEEERVEKEQGEGKVKGVMKGKEEQREE